MRLSIEPQLDFRKSYYRWSLNDLWSKTNLKPPSWLNVSSWVACNSWNRCPTGRGNPILRVQKTRACVFFIACRRLYLNGGSGGATVKVGRVHVTRYFHPCLGYHQKRGNFEVAFDTIYVEAETMATFATCLAFFTSIQSPKAVPDVNRSTKLILNAGLYPFVKRLKKLPVLPSTPIHLC